MVLRSLLFSLARFFSFSLILCSVSTGSGIPKKVVEGSGRVERVACLWALRDRYWDAKSGLSNVWSPTRAPIQSFLPSSHFSADSSTHFLSFSFSFSSFASSTSRERPSFEKKEIFPPSYRSRLPPIGSRIGLFCGEKNHILSHCYYYQYCYHYRQRYD